MIWGSKRVADRGRESDNKKGDPFGGGIGHSALTPDEGGFQAADAGLRQADGLLSAVGASLGGH